MAQQTTYRIEVDDRDITSSVAPLLIRLSVTNKSGHASDKADVTLDDNGGQIALPRDGAKMAIYLGRTGTGEVEVFRGKVSDVRSTGSRGEPFVLRISAEGVDPKGKAKEPKDKHWDKKPLKTILTEAAKEADITKVDVDSELATINLEYVAMQGESFMAFGERLAKMVGGTFKISDDRAAIVKRNGGRSVTGKPLTAVIAAWGVNLIKWDIAPFLGRPRFKKTRVRYYDRKEAKWKEESAEVEDDGAKATQTSRYSAGSKEEAKERAKSEKADAERSKGEGSVTIDCDPTAQPEADCNVVGVRPGIDGTYTIEGVTHDVSRSGSETSLDLKRPKGEAGKDSRKASK